MLKILIYDSGKGGLSVFHLLKKWVDENKLDTQVFLHYFSDTQNYPYGIKSDEQLQEIVFVNLSHFQSENFDIVGVACNTASGVIEKNTPLLGDATNRVSTIFGPTFSKIAELHPSQLFIIGSQYTIDHHLYGKKLKNDFSNMEIIEQAEQELINVIEHDQEQEVVEGVRRVIEQVPSHWHLLLACTHFSLVREKFEQEIKKQGKEIFLIDPAEELAKDLRYKIIFSNYMRQIPNR